MATSVGLSAPASATDEVVHLTAEEEAQSRAFLTEFDVDPAVQDRLIEGTKAGEISLADSNSAAPTSVETEIRNRSEFTVSTFADGSIFVVEREIPAAADGGAGTNAVTGCTIRGGSDYTTYAGCKLHYRSHIFSYGFYANFTQSGGNLGVITRAFGRFQDYAIGHSRESWGLRIVKARSNSAGPAKARLRINYNINPDVGQITKKICLVVSGRSYGQRTGSGC
jgi:hypothetical protein